MLPPTSKRLEEPDAVPYFLWDTGQTAGEIRRVLAGQSGSEKDLLIARILREANTRDVWLFLGWKDIDEAWTRIETRLGRARPVWEMLRARHLELRGRGTSR